MRSFHLKRADKVIICILIAAAIFAAIFTGLSGRKEETFAEYSHQITHEDYIGKKIGIMTGTNMEQAAFGFFPGSEYLYFDGYPDMNAALEAGIIDAYPGDEPALKSIHAEQPQIDYIKERLTQSSYSFAFRKNDPFSKKICDQLNEFLNQIRSDGTYEQIDAVWFGVDEDKKVVDMSGLTGENGTIHVVTTSTDEPFSYIKDGKNVGFALNVGAYGSEIMRSGIESVDRGQREAAIALGFTERQAFFNFIFPQAAVTFLPVYRGELVSLLKGTSIVGYISILDLTKMSDIIRSRTYEAFFPLLATALIYFVLAWIISVLMSALLVRIDWKSEKHIVKRGSDK